MVQAGFQRLGKVVPIGEGYCFTPGRGSLFSREMAAVEFSYIPAHKTPQPLPTSPSCASRSRLSAHPQFAFSSLGPKVSGCEHKTCALAPLQIKKEKEKTVALSPADLVSPQQRATPRPFTTGCYVVCWPGTGALCLGAWLVFLPSLLYGETPTAVLLPPLWMGQPL